MLTILGMLKAWKKVADLADLLNEPVTKTVVDLHLMGVPLKDGNTLFLVEEYKQRTGCVSKTSSELEILDKEHPTWLGSQTEHTLRATIGYQLQDVGLELLTRSSRNLSRFTLRRPNGQIVQVQSYVSKQPQGKKGNAANFTIHRLQEEPTPGTWWYVFAVSGLAHVCLFSHEEIRERFLRKGKTVPKRTTITITQEVARQNSLEKRKDELRGEPDEETKMKLLEQEFEKKGGGAPQQ